METIKSEGRQNKNHGLSFYWDKTCQKKIAVENSWYFDAPLSSLPGGCFRITILFLLFIPSNDMKSYSRTKVGLLWPCENWVKTKFESLHLRAPAACRYWINFSSSNWCLDLIFDIGEWGWSIRSPAPGPSIDPNKLTDVEYLDKKTHWTGLHFFDALRNCKFVRILGFLLRKNGYLLLSVVVRVNRLFWMASLVTPSLCNLHCSLLASESDKLLDLMISIFWAIFFWSPVWLRKVEEGWIGSSWDCNFYLSDKIRQKLQLYALVASCDRFQDEE